MGKQNLHFRVYYIIYREINCISHAERIAIDQVHGPDVDLNSNLLLSSFDSLALKTHSFLCILSIFVKRPKYKIEDG